MSLILTAFASLALQAAPVVVVEGKVEQFRQAASAAEQHLPNAVEVDPTSPQLAAQLDAAPVVVAVGRRALSAAREAAPHKPVVFCMVLGVGQKDLSPTVTGVPLESDPREVLRLIHSALPAAHKIGVVFDPRESALQIERAKQAAAEFGLQLQAQAVSNGGEARDALDAQSGLDALWLPPDPKLYSRELSSYVLTLASERKLPLFGFLESFTQAGALGSVSPDYADSGDRAGKLAAEIAAMPESQRQKVPAIRYAPGEFSLNLNTARALGVTIPAPAVASAGTHVFR